MKRFTLSILALSLFPYLAFAKEYENSTLDKIEVITQLIPQNELYSASISNIATKVATPLIRTPIDITVITEKQIQDRNAISISESLSYTSGLISNYRGQNSELEILVRGIGNKSDGGGVPTYLNGIAYQGSYEIDPFFLESINVIKGPSSVLYGQSNPGGIVDIVTKMPTGKDKNVLQAKVGTNDYYQLGVDVDRRLNDTLSFRLLGNLNRLDWKENYVRQKGGAIAPSLTWTPDDKTELTLYAFYQKKPKAGDRNFFMKESIIDGVNGSKAPYDFFISDPNFHKLSLEQWHIGYRLSHKFNESVSFRQNLRYNKSENILHNLVAWDPVPNKTEITRKARIFEDRWQEFGVDNYIESKFTTKALHHTLLTGFEYKQSRYDLLAYLGDAPSINWVSPSYGVNVEPPALQMSSLKSIKQGGIYVQDQIEVGNLDITLGGRYDHARSLFMDRKWNEEQKQNDRKFTWRTGAIYNFSNGIAPYFSYSTSFQPEVGLDGNKKPLKPTTAEQYEVGIKYQPSETILLTAAIYRINQKNLVTYDPQTYDKLQTGKIRNKGLEASLTANVNENLSLIASYAYTNREVKENTDTSPIGKTPWGVPRHQGSLWTKYTWTKGFLDGLNIGAGVRYIGKTQGDPRNTFTVPHYTLYDASIGYNLAKISSALTDASLQLNIHNLTNKEYVSSCANAYSCFYGTGRSTVLTFNYQW